MLIFTVLFTNKLDRTKRDKNIQYICIVFMNYCILYSVNENRSRKIIIQYYTITINFYRRYSHSYQSYQTDRQT